MQGRGFAVPGRGLVPGAGPGASRWRFLGGGRGAPGKAPTHTAVWLRSEKMRSVKSASSPTREALGTIR